VVSSKHTVREANKINCLLESVKGIREDTDMPIHILKLQIRFVVERDGDGFHAYCPDLKGIHVDGATEQEALDNAREAVQAYICSLVKHEDPIPVGVLQEEWPSLVDFVRHKFRARFAPSRVSHSVIREITLPAY
jgi:predicted RNase H-like HicB family nuclease